MKKIIVALALILALWCGTAFADSINGLFEGKPIVLVKHNGTALNDEDVPAYIDESRTMVPIYLLRQLGLDVTWKPNDYSVDVSDPKKVTQSGLDALGVQKWSGKKWAVIGDSITEHNFRTNKNYQDYICQKIACTAYNYGVSGTGWFTPSSVGGSNAIYQRIPDMVADADLITVFAGTNDWGQVGKSFVMGKFGDADPAESFYGAVDYTLKQLVTKYPTKVIAVFTPLQRSNGFSQNSAGVTLEQVADAIIQVAHYYGIPVLDLYRNNNLYVWNAASNRHYFTAPGYTEPDGLHPNDAGHQVLANKILSFINSL